MQSLKLFFPKILFHWKKINKTKYCHGHVKFYSGGKNVCFYKIMKIFWKENFRLEEIYLKSKYFEKKIFSKLIFFFISKTSFKNNFEKKIIPKERFLQNKKKNRAKIKLRKKFPIKNLIVKKFAKKLLKKNSFKTKNSLKKINFKKYLQKYFPKKKLSKKILKIDTL